MVSELIGAINPSATMAVDSKAGEMIAAGENVIKFGIGAPDFDTPENIKEAAKKAIDAGYTKYTPASGLPELKKAICEKHQRENGLSYMPNQICASNGAKHALYNAIMALCNPGDEVLIPSPFWVSYEEMVNLARAKSVFVPCSEETAFELNADDVAAVITDKTKVLLLNSPNNPTGAVIGRAQLRKIADLAIEKNIWVISDEVYEHFLYTNEPYTSFAALSDEAYARTITINAISKTYAMTGWRIGWSAAPADVTKSIANFQSQATGNPCSISQVASVAALIGQQDSVKEMKLAFYKRRNYTVKRLNEMPGITCVNPPGAFYAFPNVKSLYGDKVKDSEDMTMQLLEKAKVATVQGRAFGADDYIRISYANTMENLSEGMDRILEFVEKIN